jgi:alanine dehydrogenase
MIIGIPKEIKNQEYRVGLRPDQVKSLTADGHQVFVEKNAGVGAGFVDHQYLLAGAYLVESAAEVFGEADMVVKVKEPQKHERQMLRAGQILFTYLHLAPDYEQTEDLLASDAIAIAYETITSSQGSLPLLAPMSEVAGRMSIQAAAHHLEARQKGGGLLMGGIPGVPAAKVLILGAGIVGTNALQMALGLGADVTILDQSLSRLRELDVVYGNRVKTRAASACLIDELVQDVDVLIGAVLVPGSAAPKLIQFEHVQSMKPGTVMVDVAIDQGGCFETSKPTTHDTPTYLVNQVVHYCVANMPGAVPRTSTYGLTNATFPYIRSIASLGLNEALSKDIHLQSGLSIYRQKLTCSAVGSSQNRSYENAEAVLMH